MDELDLLRQQVKELQASVDYLMASSFNKNRKLEKIYSMLERKKVVTSIDIRKELNISRVYCYELMLRVSKIYPGIRYHSYAKKGMPSRLVKEGVNKLTTPPQISKNVRVYSS